MLVIRCQARLQGARPAEPLQTRRDLGVIQVGMVTTAGADELVRGGVAAFHPAVRDVDRLTPHEGCRAMAGLTGKRGGHDGADVQPRITGMGGAARCRDDIRTGNRLSTGRDVKVSRAAHACLQASGLFHCRGLEQHACQLVTIPAVTAQQNSAELESAWVPTFNCHGQTCPCSR